MHERLLLDRKRLNGDHCKEFEMARIEVLEAAYKHIDELEANDFKRVAKQAIRFTLPVQIKGWFWQSKKYTYRFSTGGFSTYKIEIDDDNVRGFKLCY